MIAFSFEPGGLEIEGFLGEWVSKREMEFGIYSRLRLDHGYLGSPGGGLVIPTVVWSSVRNPCAAEPFRYRSREQQIGYLPHGKGEEFSGEFVLLDNGRRWKRRKKKTEMMNVPGPQFARNPTHGVQSGASPS